ncbi:MAG: TusE/DsrC/DsvC family sulfur relay protein [Gammaproteobacteria bacterium]|nr:TusE/DsrC/DsvC family sulfur relay protein [Gammaproteobacteria bacterium]
MSEVMTDEEKMRQFFHVDDGDELVIPWDHEVATTLAKEVGISMSDKHWELVDLLRHHYEELGAVEYARDLSGMLDQRYQSQGGLRYLYSLFPGGPITQASKIAGLPVPKDSSNNSFGYSV